MTEWITFDHAAGLCRTELDIDPPGVRDAIDAKEIKAFTSITLDADDEYQVDLASLRRFIAAEKSRRANAFQPTEADVMVNEDRAVFLLREHQVRDALDLDELVKEKKIYGVLNINPAGEDTRTYSKNSILAHIHERKAAAARRPTTPLMNPPARRPIR